MLACGGCVSTLIAGPALAQPSAGDRPDAASKGALAQARAHFRAASEHYRAGRFREALRGFELAERLMPGPELWFNIARTHEQLGEIEDAITSYERYVQARADAADVGAVRARIAALKSSLVARPAQQAQHTALRVDAEPGAEIKLDGEPLGTAPIDRIVWIEPGKHLLEAELKGHARFRAELDAPAGSMVAGSIDLVQYSAVAAKAERHRDGSQRAGAGAASLPTWIAGGASIASAIVSAAARTSAEASRSDGDLDGADAANAVAGVALGCALTSGVLAAVLFFAAPNHVESSTVLR